MASQKPTVRQDASRPRRSEQFKDDVYRQMFRLEASRPGADLDLALALLRAWTAADSKPNGCEQRQWLKKICPICILMIEAASRLSRAQQPSLQ